MSPFRTRLFQLLAPSPSEPARHIPREGDDVEQWLTAERDQHSDRFGEPPAWFLIDALLADYQAHARAGVPLDQPPCSCTPADCAGCDRHPF